VIKWSQIEAETEGYREGFVAVFRKYEGQETDERDESNRVVKVTMASFARHMGIPQRTFFDWCNPPDVVADTATTYDDEDEFDEESEEKEEHDEFWPYAAHRLGKEGLEELARDDKYRIGFKTHKQKSIYASARKILKNLRELKRHEYEDRFKYVEFEDEMAKWTKEWANELPPLVLEKFKKRDEEDEEARKQGKRKKNVLLEEEEEAEGYESGEDDDAWQ
jgi:hypothetical protein